MPATPTADAASPPPHPGRAGVAPRVWPLFVGTFFLAAGGGLVFPLLAELQDRHDLPTWGLGVISALFFVGSVAGQLGLAPLGDRGHARRLLLAGVALNMAALVWFAFGTELWQFTAARGLQGLATGMFLPAARASLVRSDPRRAGLLLGRFAGTETGGFVFGPVIGTVIFTALGLQAPFLIVTLPLLAVFVLLARVALPGTAPATAIPARGTPAGATPAGAATGPAEPGAAALAPAPPTRFGVLSSLDLLRRRGVAVAVVLQLSVFLPVGIYESLWARYLDDRGASTLLIGVGLSLYGLPFVLTAPTGGRLADKLGPVRSATLAMLVVIPTTAAYGLVAVPLVIIALALVEAVGNATAVPGAQTAMARSCPPARLTAGQGLSGAVSMLGAGVSAAVAAPVYEAFGPAWLFGGAAACMTALVVAAQVIDRWGGVRGVPDTLPAVDSWSHSADVDTPIGAVPLDPHPGAHHPSPGAGSPSGSTVP